MTDLRAKAIEAMARAALKSERFEDVDEWEKQNTTLWRAAIQHQTAAFDAQHGIVRVVPPEATEEMEWKANSIISSYRGETLARLNSANRIGDLTRASK